MGKRTSALTFVAALSVSACDGIAGIEDLRLADQDGSTATGRDGGTGAGQDGGSSTDGGGTGLATIRGTLTGLADGETLQLVNNGGDTLHPHRPHGQWARSLSRPSSRPARRTPSPCRPSPRPPSRRAPSPTAPAPRAPPMSPT